MTQEEYNRIMGIGAVDIGGKANLLREVKKLARKKSYRVSGFNKLNKQQLFKIYHKEEPATGWLYYEMNGEKYYS